MYFYIVTPSYNALAWLQQCVRSVADQAADGLMVHHHVQDGGSGDGTAAWLEQWQRTHADTPGYCFTYESCRDNGMYNAINRAWDKLPAQADITAHLNADEQYLPQVLPQIAAAMAADTRADMTLGTYIITDAAGRYICHRRPVLPHLSSSRTVCEIITCSCFHRVTSFRRHGIRFDESYKALADLIFYRDILSTAPRFCMLPQLITGTFSVTGDNLGWSEASHRELSDYLRSLPWYVGRRHRLTNLWCNLKRRLVDARCTPPAEYSLYSPGTDTRRIVRIQKPTCHWGCRTEGEGSPDTLRP